MDEGKMAELEGWKDGGSSQSIGSYARSFEETGTRYGFSLGSCNDGRSTTPRMTDDSNVKLFNNCSINNSVNSYVRDLLQRHRNKE